MSVYHHIWGAGVESSSQPAAHPADPVTCTMPLYTLTVDRNKGGAVTSVIFGGHELISNQSAGDQWQVAVHTYADGKWSNPTQAGSSGWDAWVPSPIISCYTSERVVDIRVSPMEWEQATWGYVHWVWMRLGHRIDLDYAGFGGLIRHEAAVYLPIVPMPPDPHGWLWTMAHTSPVLSTPWRLGTGGVVRVGLAVEPPQPYKRSLAYDEPYQSAILSSDDRSLALGVLASGDYNCSEISVHPRAGGTADCTRIGVGRHNVFTPQGDSRFVSWWAVGSLDRVVFLLKQVRRFVGGGTLCPPGIGPVRKEAVYA